VIPIEPNEGKPLEKEETYLVQKESKLANRIILNLEPIIEVILPIV